jgi:hypothetical protein
MPFDKVIPVRLRASALRTMFGYYVPPPKPKAPPVFAEGEPVLLMFCHQCGCAYPGYCPLDHTNVRVTLRPGREGFVIG